MGVFRQIYNRFLQYSHSRLCALWLSCILTSTTSVSDFESLMSNVKWLFAAILML